MTPKNSTSSETRALQSLQALISQACATHNPARTADGIRVRCGRFEVDHVTGVIKAPGHVKADFILIAETQPVLYLSHKASDFSHNGYGSGGKKAFPHRSPYRDAEIWKFARWAAEYCVRHQETRATSDGVFEWIGELRGVWCLPPARVQNLIVYGAEFGRPEFGSYNCHVAAVGAPQLEDCGSYHRLAFEDSTTSNGEVPPGDDEPIICIAGRTANQRDTYWTHDEAEGRAGFHGWLGFFPYRIIRLATEAKRVGKMQHGKGDNLEKVEWPFS